MHLASTDLPEPGGPSIITSCDPAEAITASLFAVFSPSRLSNVTVSVWGYKLRFMRLVFSLFPE